MKFRFHALGVPHTITNQDYLACAFTQKVYKFCKMMTNLGHTVIHYGHEDSVLQCTEHVPVMTKQDFEKAGYVHFDPKQNFFNYYDVGDPAYLAFYNNSIREIKKRKQKNDFILPFWGHPMKPICDAHSDLICVEPGIGYGYGHWADWKVFESYAIYHAYCGLENIRRCNQKWYDVVIPNYFDVDDFIYNNKKEDYFLFLGRVYNGKGVDTAIDVTRKIGAKLIIAGQNSIKKTMGYTEVPEHVTEIGFADRETRKKLMANAKAAILPSMYIEPFCGVQVECMFSGTPTITTDWGAFVENNLHGITGFRCHTFDEFVWAAKNIDQINPENCRNWAVSNFSLERVGKMYEEYFKNIINVYAGNGWHQEEPDRQELHFNNKYYPFM